MTHENLKQPTGSKHERRLAGRPRIQSSDTAQKRKRREQLRNAQDAYRDRKQKEIMHIKKMNNSLKAATNTLGTSLASLLENIVTQNALQHSMALNEKVADSIRNMLQLTQVMQEDEVDAINSTALSLEKAPVGPVSETIRPEIPITATQSPQILEKAKRVQFASQTNSYFATTDWPMLNFGRNYSTDINIFSPLVNPANSTKAPSSSHLSHQSPASPFSDWFAAKSILLEPSLDLFTTPARRHVSLADRINHHALLRAGRLLEDHTTTMDLVYKIFPFDKNPAPPHTQLAKIRYLVSKSQPYMNGTQNSPIPLKVIRRFRCSHGYQSCEECSQKAYPLWLSARDIEFYLAERWNVSTDSEEPHLMSFRLNLEQEQISIKRLRILDLIDGFIENGICLVDVPAFQRAEVDRVVGSLIESTRLLSI